MVRSCRSVFDARSVPALSAVKSPLGYLRDWHFRRMCGKAAHSVVIGLESRPESGVDGAAVSVWPEYLGLAEAYWAAYILAQWPREGLLRGRDRVPAQARVEAALTYLTAWLSARVLVNHTGPTVADEVVATLFPQLRDDQGTPPLAAVPVERCLPEVDRALTGSADRDIPAPLDRLIDSAIAELDVPGPQREELLFELQLRWGDLTGSGWIPTAAGGGR